MRKMRQSQTWEISGYGVIWQNLWNFFLQESFTSRVRGIEFEKIQTKLGTDDLSRSRFADPRRTR